MFPRQGARREAFPAMPEIPTPWRALLADEITQPYYAELQTFVAEERKRGDVFPGDADVFRALELPPEAVRVVLLGQDPYATPGKAHGLSFSVRPGVAQPPSLRNILAELTALYLALTLVPERAAVTIVHDYEGVGAWMTGRWKAKDPIVAQVVAACHGVITSSARSPIVECLPTMSRNLSHCLLRVEPFFFATGRTPG